MKKTVFILIFLSFINNIAFSQKSNDSIWKKVEELELKNLPKSALIIVDSIYSSALKENNSNQIIKSLFYKSKFSLILNEDAQLSIIQDFKKQINKSSFPSKNVLENILGNLYWQYFKKNRYQFYQRTRTKEKVDSLDFRTWDLNTIFAEIHKHYQNAFTNSDELKKTSSTIFKDIIDLKKDSETFRPTLYDFLSHNALEFYKTTESNITKPTIHFKVDNPIYFANFESFSKLNLNAKDSLSLQFNALKIYQNLIKFHQKNKDKSALAEVDIERLKYVEKYASVNLDKNNYLNALLNTEKKIANNKASGRYAFEIATYYFNQSNKENNTQNKFKKTEALKICNRVLKDFPNSYGAKKCSILKHNIEQKSLSITAEKFLPTNTPSRLLINYKNIDKLYFRSYKINNFKLDSLNRIYNVNEIISYISKLKKVNSWSSNLRNENDYKEHTTEIVVPKFKKGTYIILASESKNFKSDKIYGITSVQVTNLALIESNQSGKYIYQVVDRNTGRPIKNATINIYNLKSKYVDSRNLKTNRNGFATFKSKKTLYNVEISVFYKNEKVRFGTRSLYTFNDNYLNDDTDEEVIIKPFIFTDRSIYRPGQKVYFKAIVLKKQGEKSEIFKNEYVEVILYNSNNQEVKTLDLKLNEFGSVSGEFTIPNNGLTGKYLIEIDEGGLDFDSKFYDNENYDFDYDNDYTISVEEYKRPKFKTEFRPITQSFIINDSVTVKGFAEAFAGSNITNAKVNYTVTRKIQYPSWYYWRNINRNNAAQEITFGETKTNDKGEFDIVFKALADETILKENLPTFTYQITADVTDINGETRSNSTIVKVGYHSLNLALNIPAVVDKTKLKTIAKITTENLNNEFVPAKGTLKIHKLIAPTNPLRKRAWEAPDYQDISESKFRKLFPNEPYKEDETNEDNWKKGKLVFESTFNTLKEKEIIINNIKNWISGKYIATINSEDKFGFKVKDQKRFRVYSYKEKTIADNKLFFIQMDKNTYKPKDNINLKLSSASKNMTVSVLIEKNHKIKKTILVHLNNESKIIKIPVKKKDIGGFAIKYQYVNYNAFDQGSLTIYVPKKQENQLQIQTNIFRDRLQPGQKQTWSFTIKDDENNAVASEILASMYDASLDEFKHHQWEFNPNPYYQSYNSSFYTNANNSFYTSRFRIKNNRSYFSSNPTLKFDSYNWFGFNFNNNSWKTQQYLKKLKRKNQAVAVSKSGKYTGAISGVVEDDSGPLPGVSVLIKGTTDGTETDFDGNFQIKVKKGDVLSFSYLGYKSVEVTVGSYSTLNINLQEDANVLDEVVVTALAIKKDKKTLGYKALQGKVAGVQISKNTIKEKLIKSLSTIKARTNFNETAFFYPKLKTDKNGKVSFNFTVPEALTNWKLQLLAHSDKLQIASKTLTTVTQKELMVMPNTPRFLRQGDQITISAKISNLTNNKLNGVAQLQLTDAITGKEINIDLKNIDQTKDFTVEKEGNTNVSWNLTIPESIQTVQYKIVATSGNFSDGEQNILPVLSNRKLVTETLPIWIRSNQTKTFTLDKLKNNTSTTLKNHKLTLEMTSNPAWNAIQALPYLMEYPYDCAEQTFSKYYANTLASFVANSNPKVQKVFNSWKSSKSLISNLEKNQELKSLIIQETPWLRDALSETEQKNRIGLLFDLNRMKNEKEKTFNKLKELQLANGGFSWFKGGEYANPLISLHIASGFGHLKKLGVKKFNSTTEKMIVRTVEYLDSQILENYKNLLKFATRIKTRKKFDGEKAAQEYLRKKHLGYFELQYLYMRSFYPSIKITSRQQEALDYYMNQSGVYWNEFNLYGKAQIALFNFRSENKTIAKNIIKSLKENSITSDQLGMYWKANKSGYYFHQSTIETQSLLIEAFSEIENKIETIDNLKVWLLKNKQTNRWKTTKATTEAVYALMLNGTNWLSITDMVDVTVGKEKIDSVKLRDTKIEAGTGYYKTSWNGNEIKPELGKVKVTKKGKGIAWGGLYWQYFEDLDKITFSKSPLNINKKLFLKVNTNSGKELREITDKTILKVGDLITVRIEVRSDRRMEFIHMKDMRASGLEPISVLSKYKWQDGLGYYQSTKDASTNFFFDNIPKGVYVFEYDLRVSNAGNFSNGITTIQSMYAPEFSSHSKGIRINIK